MAFMAVVNLGVSFFFNWFLLRTLGASAESDAVFAALVVPQAVVMVLSAVAGKSFTPHLASLPEKDQEVAAWGMIQGLGLLFFLLAWFLRESVSVWIGIFFSAYGPNVRAETEHLARILVWLLPAQACLSVAQGFSHARGWFLTVELSAFVGAVLGLVCLVIALPRFGGAGYAWAALFRVIVSTVPLLFLLGPLRRLRWDRAFPGVLLKRMSILAGGSFAYKLTYLVDRVLSALSPAGGLSLFQVAQQVYGAGEVVLQKAVSGPALSRMANRLSAGDTNTAKSIYQRGIKIVTLCSIAAFALVATAGLPVLNFVFAGGRLSDSGIRSLWMLMVSLGGQLLSPVVLSLSNLYYARGDTWTPTWIGMVGVPIALAIRILFFGIWGLQGLALATSVYYGLLVLIYGRLSFSRGKMC